MDRLAAHRRDSSRRQTRCPPRESPLEPRRTSYLVLLPGREATTSATFVPTTGCPSGVTTSSRVPAERGPPGRPPDGRWRRQTRYPRREGVGCAAQGDASPRTPPNVVPAVACRPSSDDRYNIRLARGPRAARAGSKPRSRPAQLSPRRGEPPGRASPRPADSRSARRPPPAHPTGCPSPHRPRVSGAGRPPLHQTRGTTRTGSRAARRAGSACRTWRRPVTPRRRSPGLAARRPPPRTARGAPPK